MNIIKLTQQEFDAIPTLNKQEPEKGLVIKKISRDKWYRLTYRQINIDEIGSADILVEEIQLEKENSN